MLKTRLIDVINAEFNGYPIHNVAGSPLVGSSIYTLDCKKLEKAKMKFYMCEEFENCDLIIAQSPSIEINGKQINVGT